MTSDKTIDGRGADVHIAGGAGITIMLTKNIIICNIHIHDIKVCNGANVRDSVDHVGPRAKSDGDGIAIMGGTNVWLEHLSMSRAIDGLIDATQGSTAITVSNCLFTDHDKALLYGYCYNVALDKKMQITTAFNHFGKGLVQWMPRCRSGFFHVVNNYYTDWGIYAIGGGSKSTIIYQGNLFSPTNDASPKEVTRRMCPKNDEWKKWIWTSEGDVFEKGTFFTPSGDPKASKKFGADQMIPFQPGKMVPTLTKDLGTLPCQPDKGC